jgi:DNA-binding GntR family transcriptional regulator
LVKVAKSPTVRQAQFFGRGVAPGNDDEGATTETQTARLYEELRGAILRGELTASEEISQVQLANKLGTSRTPLREVLRMLQREGLVISQPNRRLQIAGVSLAELEQIYATRLPLEALAMRYSVPRLDSATIARLEGTMAEMAHFASEDEWDRWEVVHREFHHHLVSKAGKRIMATLGDLFDHSSRYRRVYTFSQPSQTWPLGTLEHRAILNAAKARDAQRAAVRLAQHLARTPLTLFEATRPDYEPGLLHEALVLISGTTELPSEEEIAAEAAGREAPVRS